MLLLYLSYTNLNSLITAIKMISEFIIYQKEGLPNNYRTDFRMGRFPVMH